MLMSEADELVSLVCDKLCQYPFVCQQEELDKKCERCPLVERLMKEVQNDDEDRLYSGLVEED